MATWAESSGALILACLALVANVLSKSVVSLSNTRLITSVIVF